MMTVKVWIIVLVNFLGAWALSNPDEELCLSIEGQCPLLKNPRSPPRIPYDDVYKPVVNMEILLHRLVELNEAEQRLSIHASLTVFWYLPSCAQWNKVTLTKEAYSLRKCRFKKDDVWVPHILFRNGYYQSNAIEKHSGNSVSVYNCTSCDFPDNPGMVPLPYAAFTSMGKFDSFCAADNIQRFPFHTVQCSWEIVTEERRDELVINTVLVKTLSNSEGSVSFASSADVWTLIRYWTNETGDRPQNLFRLWFHFDRHPQHLMLSIVLPFQVLFVVQLAALMMHPEEPERPCFSVMVLLAFAMLHSGATADIPKTSEPVFFHYYIQTYFIISGILTIQTLTMSVWARSNTQEMTLRKYRVMRMRVTAYRIADIVFATISVYTVLTINLTFFYILFAAN